MRTILIVEQPYEQSYPQKLGKKVVTDEGDSFYQFNSAHHTTLGCAPIWPFLSTDQRNRCHVAGRNLNQLDTAEA